MAKTGYHRGRQSDVLTYIFDKPAGKHVTINELEKHFKGKYDRNQIMATMANVCGRRADRYGLPIEKVTQGVWKVIGNDNGSKPKQEELPLKSGYDTPDAESDAIIAGDPGTPGDEVVMGPATSFMQDVKQVLGDESTSVPVEPSNDKGVRVKARNGILYVNGEPANLEVFIAGLRLAVRIS